MEVAPPKVAAEVSAAAGAENDPQTDNTVSADDYSANHITEVHLHVLAPQGAQGRAVTCLSEAALLARLSDKLRPHLADAMAGMVRVTVQKQTAQLVSQFQQQLLAEIPATVDEILQHNLAAIMQQIKQEQQSQGG